MKKYSLFFAFLLSSFWTLFLWGFFEGKGVYAFGINAFLFLSAVLALFLWQLKVKKGSLQKYLYWIIPLTLIALSFALYENPFLKSVSTFLVFPAAFAIFYNLSFLSNKAKGWDAYLVSVLLTKIFSFVSKIKESVNLHFSYIFPAEKEKAMLLKKAILGVLLFLVIAFLVIIPLLSSADADFGEKMGFIYQFLEDIINPQLVYKFLFIFALSFTMLAMLLSWTKELILKDRELAEKKKESIVPGIFVGGTSLLYLLFLWVQAERLFVGALPFEFNEVVYLVKSGFWQLFFLSILNILIYISTYKKTNNFVQKLLFGFIVISLLLLFSAGHRMILYVTYYGFSYEKLFALYAVLFFAILFFWMTLNFFFQKQKSILRFLVLLFLWMYAFLVISPVEQFVFRSNVYLKNNVENSHIRLSELRMLSSDVLSLVEKHKESGILAEERIVDATRKQPITINQDVHWNNWIENKKARIESKSWYELNISNILYLAKNK